MPPFPKPPSSDSLALERIEAELEAQRLDGIAIADALKALLIKIPVFHDSDADAYERLGKVGDRDR